MGRPKKKIKSPPPEELVYLMAGIGHTWVEIAETLNQPESTIRSRDEFSRAFKKGQSEFKTAIRHRQFQIMMSEMPGNAMMAKWLGIQMLGQRDKTDINTNATLNIRKDLEAKEPTQRKDLISKLADRCGFEPASN